MLQLERADDCYSLSQEEKTAMVFIIFCLFDIDFDFAVNFDLRFCTLVF